LQTTGDENGRSNAGIRRDIFEPQLTGSAQCRRRKLVRRVGRRSVPAIPQQSDREDAVGPGSLPGNSQRLNEECGEIGPRPNPNTRHGDDWHTFLFHPNI
jgi:hypothetical protein